MGTLPLNVACTCACLLIAIASNDAKPHNATCRLLHQCMYGNYPSMHGDITCQCRRNTAQASSTLLQALLHSITVALQHRCSQLAAQLARRWCHIPAAALSQPIAAGSEGRTVSWRSETARCSWSATSPQTSWLIPSCMLRWLA